jgi:integrase
VGFIRKTPAGAFRACWREPSGRQRSKTFKTKREASAFLAETESALSKGSYVDPNAGRLRFGDFAARWLASREVEARTAERTLSALRTHVLPQWGRWPLSKIDHMAVQEWVSALVRRRARGTVIRCHSTLSMILKTAVRARLIAVNPAEGVRIPASRHARDVRPTTISREDFFGRLLPAVPDAYRAMVCVAAGAGLRWGECAGLSWASVDLTAGRLRVVQVAVETASAVTLRPFPKSRAGVRTVPLPAFVVQALTAHRSGFTAELPADALVFPSRGGAGPLRRNNFRRRVWLPSLVRAGLLGRVTEHKDGYRASWRDGAGCDHERLCQTEREAVALVAEHAGGGLRFHDLRHSYATWLITEGVPVNVVRMVMGHEQASTTLDLYTHTPEDYEQRVIRALDGAAAFSLPIEPGDDEMEESGDDDYPA